MSRDHRGHQQRADRGRGPHRPERPGSRLQDVLGIDRQQRGGAAEQDREQVERDRAEDRGIAAHEVQAGEQSVQTFVLGSRNTFGSNHAAQGTCDQRQRRHQHEWRAGRDCISEPADGRAADGGDLPGAGRQRGRPLQHGFRRDGRQKRRRRRALEGAGQPEHAEHDEEVRRGERIGEQPRANIARGEALHELAELDDALAVITVGRVSGDEDEEGARNELHETRKAEIEDAAGQCIDLPAHRHGRDLIGEFRQASRGDVEQQRTMSRQRDG